MNRRASIIAPLVLMLVGGLFLLHNLRPELSVPRLVAQYWPWVLIGWGVVRLAEILVWHSRGQELPRTGVSGGEWGFVIFLCLLGTSIAGAQRFTSSWPSGRFTGWGWEIAGESFDFPITAETQAEGVRKVVLENLRGNARISGSDDIKVKLSGRKVVRAFDRSTAESADKKTPVVFSRQGETLFVRTNQEGWSGDERISAEVDVTVPKGVTLECAGRYGDFDITDMRGPVTVKSSNAGVRLQNITGPALVDVQRSDIVKAVNMKGDVELRGGGSDVEFENIEGQVTVNFAYTGEVQFRHLAKPLKFRSKTVSSLSMERIPGQVRMSRGDIEADNIVNPRIDAESKDVRLTGYSGSAEVRLTRRGDIRLTPGRGVLGAIDARTASGEIELALPDKAGFTLSAKVDRGSVENDYGAPLMDDSSGRGGRITGTTGAGPSLQLESERGKIRVRKGAPLLAQQQ
jgi:DUF4097 and DUF4098 domain-containing protein YvlB